MRYLKKMELNLNDRPPACMYVTRDVRIVPGDSRVNQELQSAIKNELLGLKNVTHLHVRIYMVIIMNTCKWMNKLKIYNLN